MIFEEEGQKCWNCRLSELLHWMSRRSFGRHLTEWTLISGLLLQVRQAQRFFFEELKNAHKDIRSLAGVHIAAIGQGTAKVLEERGILVDLIPEIYDGDALGEALAAKLTGGEKILLPRARKGNENLVKILKTHGARVDDIATYDTVYEKSRLINVGEEIRTGSIDCVVFTSASTVKGFVESTGLADYSGVVAACIGKQTKAAADAYGMQTYVAEKATIEALIDLVVKIKNK